MPDDLQQEIPEESEQQLCLSCVEPNDPAAHFCIKCGTPLTSYAATAPFERIFAEGAAYRHAAEHPQKFIVVLGIWMIFSPMAIVAFMLLAGGLVFGLLPGIFIELAGVGLMGISLVMIGRTTWNYLTRKKITQSEE